MAPPVLLSGSQPVAQGARLDLSPSAVPLLLRIPEGEMLTTATLRLAAASDAPAPLVPQHLSSDLGAFPAGKPIRFVIAVLDGETAISGLTLAGAEGMARVRIFGNGAWSPLAPVDTVGLGEEQVFPAVAAQRLVAEFLAPKPPQVPVPAPLAVTTIALKATPQPCHVSVAVGDDPPFFSTPGPLPTTPVGVDGLARIAARWKLDHPGASDVPLRIAAAGHGAALIAAFEVASSPAPTPPPPGDGASSPAPRPPPPVLPAPPETRRALLCDDGHAAAQSFAAPLSAQALSALALWVRPGPGGVTGRVTLHPDEHGRPGKPALADELDFTLGAEAGRLPRWLTLSPADPVRLSDPWWAVCRVAQGEMLWYRAPAASRSTGPLVSVDGGPWQDAAPDPTVAGLQAESSWARAVP